MSEPIILPLTPGYRGSLNAVVGKKLKAARSRRDEAAQMERDAEAIRDLIAKSDAVRDEMAGAK